MKKTIKILSLILLFTINCNCQVTTIVPRSEYDFPNGAYLKDLDNELPFYVDTWVGFQDNKKYTFEFVKFTQQLSQYEPGGDYNYRDELVGKFKVENIVTGDVLYNNIPTIAFEDYKIFLTSLRTSASFSYVDKVNCFNSADFFLVKVIGNPNQLKYEHFTLTEFMVDGCPYTNQADIPMFLPTGDLILTRQ